MGCLLRAVPAAVPGIAFLSGGQSGELASARLNAMNVRFKSRLPWALAFSFARAIQQPALEIWQGEQVARAGGTASSAVIEPDATGLRGAANTDAVKEMSMRDAWALGTNSLLEIYLARHGETAWSLFGPAHGTDRYPLTERGEQASRRPSTGCSGPTVLYRAFRACTTSTLDRSIHGPAIAASCRSVKFLSIGGIYPHGGRRLGTVEGLSWIGSLQWEVAPSNNIPGRWPIRKGSFPRRVEPGMPWGRRRP